jgi:hypothetical protein
MYKLIKLLLLLTLFAACKRPSVKTEIVERTTISYRDTTITLPGETIHDTLMVQIDCDSLGRGSIRPTKSIKSGQKTKSTIIASGNTISIECKTDSLELTIKGLNKEIEKLKKETKVVEVERKVIPFYVKLLIGLLILAVIVLSLKNIF